MISAIIMDDEWAVGQLLGVQLQMTDQFEVKHIFQNPYEMMDAIAIQPVDVVFLDISMPEISGLALAQKLSELEHPPEVIFVTAYNDYALEAFRVNALDYLVKPVHEKELERIIEKVQKRLSQKNIHTVVGNESSSQQSNKPLCIEEMLRLKFPTAKCEELLLYLLLIGTQPISKWRLIEDLWPEKEVHKGESNLRTTVFRLNQAMSQANIDIRVKSFKGSYQLKGLSDEQSSHTISLFPAVNASSASEESLLTLLMQHNPYTLLKDKDYIWSIEIEPYYEQLYYQWAFTLIKNVNLDEGYYVQALKYLLEYYPWQEHLLVEVMPLIFKLEGKGALSHFYKAYESNWKKLFDTSLSPNIQQLYKHLMEN